MNVKEFLRSVGTSLEDKDTREMVESAYYEDNKMHYELIFNDDDVTNDTEIVRIEESKSSVCIYNEIELAKFEDKF